MSTPKTITLLLAQISKLQSRKAVLNMLIAHLRICYCESSDTGPAEMRVTRADLGVVPAEHIEDSIIEMEGLIDIINAELEELQNQPFGGGAPPSAEVKAPAGAAKEKKGTAPSGKPRPQGTRPS